MKINNAQRIRMKACECAAMAIACRKDDEDPTPLVWSLTVFFEEYIRKGANGTIKDFGPKEPARLVVAK